MSHDGMTFFPMCHRVEDYDEDGRKRGSNRHGMLSTTRLASVTSYWLPTPARVNCGTC